MSAVGDIPVDEVTAPWWDATRESRFVLQRCLSCEQWQHYPRALCTHCGGVDLEYAAASGRGTVDVATEVRRAPRADLQVPYVIGRVRLAEGPLLLTRLVDCDETARQTGQPVVLAWEPLPDGRQLPVFQPDRDSDVPDSERA